MTDIVQRLRMERRATAWRRGLDCDFPTAFEQHPLCQEAAAEITRLRAEAEALRKDAERYRWLRDGCNYKHSAANSIAVNRYGMERDAEIDAALDATKGTT